MSPSNSDLLKESNPNALLPKVGTKWVWEIDSDEARCLLEVRLVEWNGEEWWVTTVPLLHDSYSLYNSLRAIGLEAGRDYVWDHLARSPVQNELGRFWEAVTPVGGGFDDMVEQRPEDANG